MLKQYAIFPDAHLPYEGPALRVFTKCLPHVPKLAGIYSLGDLAELESVSRHRKTEVSESLLLNETEYVNSFLNNFLKNHSIPFHWILGNHENRLHNWLLDFGRPLLGLLTIQKLFKESERSNLTMHAYSSRQLVRIPGTSIYLRHEPRKGGANHSKASCLVSSHTLIYGHTHVVQDWEHKDELGNFRRCISGGFFGNSNQSIFEYRGASDAWRPAWILVTVNTQSKKHYIDIIRIEGSECYYDKKIIRA